MQQLSQLGLFWNNLVLELIDTDRQIHLLLQVSEV